MPIRRYFLLSVALFLTAGSALVAPLNVRYLPVTGYEPLIGTLLANQVQRAYGSGNPADGLRLLAGDSWMDHTMSDHAVADTGPPDRIVCRAMDAGARWNIDATPSFLVNGKPYTGAMSAAELSTILAS